MYIHLTIASFLHKINVALYYVDFVYTLWYNVYIQKKLQTCLSIGFGRSFANVKAGWMQRKAVMVRAYTSEQDFHVDEQTLSREGWSVEPAVNAERKLGWLDRVRTRFTRNPPSAALVVTSSRQRPA